MTGNSPRLIAILATIFVSLALPVSSLAAVAWSAEPAPPSRAASTSDTLVFLKGWSTNVGYGGWRYQIWTMKSDGSAQQQVTSDPDLLPYSAAANPAGNRIAFTVGRGSSLSAGGLYVVALDGSGRRNLLAGRQQITEAQDPTWSPDGSRVAFVGYDKSIRKDIWVVNADGSELRRVTTCDCAGGDSPRWSPTDSDILAWSPAPGGGATGLALLNVDTGVSTSLYDSTASGAVTVLDYDWEPNGGRIAFTGAPWNDTSPNLYTIGSKLPAGEPRQIATPSEYSLYHPLWSPEGGRIAVSALDTGGNPSGQDVWLLDAWYGWNASAPIAGPYDEEATSWTESCRTGCQPGGMWSDLTVSQNQESDRLRVWGGLMPGEPDATIKVTLMKKRGKKWRAVRTVEGRTSSLSTYEVTMPRASYGSCRLVATWAGNGSHRAAQARTRTIIC